MTDDNCGYPTHEGHACTHPPTEDNGRCWLHADDDRKMGRPTKFNDERARQAIQAAQECKSITGCGRAAGVHHETIKNWLIKSPEYQTESGEYSDFFADFMRARAKAETLLTRGALTQPDDVDGQHARFLLKTSFGYQDIEHIAFEDASDDQRSETVEQLEAIFNE